MHTRLIVSTILIATLTLLIWMDVRLGRPPESGGTGRPGIVLLICQLLLAPVAAAEILRFDPATATRRIRVPVAAGGAALIVLFASIPLWWGEDPRECPIGETGWISLGVAAAMGVAFASYMISFRPEHKIADDLARTVLTSVYVGVLLAFWMPIRTQPGNDWGMVALLSLFVTVKMSDSFAWATGNLIGKHRLAPVLSPKKTIEGLIGGLAGGVFGAWVLFAWLAPRLTGSEVGPSFGMIVLFGLSVSAAGVFGDLAESMLKRDGGVKNSSKWLPGLGGVMDLLDSLLAAGPVVLVFWSAGWMTPALP